MKNTRVGGLTALGASLVGCCFGGGSGVAVGAESAPPAGVVLTQIAAASDHACAITATGTVECWGLNSHGQLGNGTPAPSPGAAVVVAGIHDAVEVDVMFQSSCARRHDGTVWCWGRGDTLGTGVAADAMTPVRVPGITNAVDISLELGSYVVTADGDVAGWGTNLLGFMGLPQWIEEVPTPLGVIHRDGMTEAFASGFGGCGRTSGGEALCWGAARSIALPTTGVDALSANLHTCVRAGGTWMCGGPNEHGELGITTPSTTTAVPFPRPNVRTLVTAFGATWIVGNDGSLDCVGTGCDVGVPRPALAGVQEVSADGEYACVRLPVGAHCWGRLTESTADAPTYAWSGDQLIVLTGAEPGPPGPVIPSVVVAPAQLVGEVFGHESPIDAHDTTPPGPSEPLVVGQVVAAQRGRTDAFYEGRITEVSTDGTVRVLLESGTRLSVDRSHLHIGAFDPVPDGVSHTDAPPLGPTPAPVGTLVLAFASYWFQARILADDGGSRVRVHWLGNPDANDQEISRSQVRLLR